MFLMFTFVVAYFRVKWVTYHDVFRNKAVLTDGLGTHRRGSVVRYVGLYRAGKHPGGAISPPPDFILSGEYIAHDPQGSSSNFNTLEGEWYCRSKILATCIVLLGGKGDGSPRPLRPPGVDRLNAARRDVRDHAHVPSTHSLLSRVPSAVSRMFTSSPAALRITELFNWSIHFAYSLPFHAIRKG